MQLRRFQPPTPLFALQELKRLFMGDGPFARLKCELNM